MSKKRKDKLLLNLLESPKPKHRHKHRVAMVTEESGWNQHQPNSGMARMFVIMLLIHVIVIGGIIIYDFMNGDETTKTELTQDFSATAPSTLPAPMVTDAALEKERPIDDYATYEWRSGDSLPSVAQKLGVTEDVLIKLNMLDKGVQIDQHTILRYPRRPVVKAVALNITPGQHGGAAKVSVIADSPPSTRKADADKADAPMNLTPPGETFSFEPTLLNRLTPAPTIEPGRGVADQPPAAKPSKTETSSSSNVATKTPEKPAETMVAKVEEKAPEKLPGVPKAVPVPRPVSMVAEGEKEKDKVKEKPAPKKIIESPPSAKPEPSIKSSRAYVVKPGETLYRIAAKNGVSVSALQKANNITKPESLRDGMKLVIPVK